MAKNMYGIDETTWKQMDENTRSNIIRSQGVGLSAPSPATVQTPKLIVPNNLIPLRDTATQGGASVGYDNGQVTINNNPVNTAGLTNFGANAPKGYKPNTYYGTQDQIDELLSPYVYNNPTSTEAQSALDNYNKWAQQPYTSPYAPHIEGLVKNILSRTFDYKPENDAQFQLASKALTRNVMESMNGRGILNSTITENQVQQGIADLLPQYQQIARQQFQDEGNALMKQVDMLTGLDATAYGRYQDEGSRLANALDVVMKMDDNQYTKWKDASDRREKAQQAQITAEEKKIEAQRTKVKDAWDRVSEIGYVDNQSSIVLGVPAGTLSKEARESKQKYEDDIKLKEAELKKQKELAAYQNALSMKLADYKGTSTSAPEKLGNAEQVQNYYGLRDIYLGGGNGTYSGKPLDAYNWLMAHAKENINLIGDKLYTKLLNDLTDTMKNQKAYGEKTDTSVTFTIDDWGKTLDAEFIPKYNSDGEIVNQPVTDQETREKRILDLGLDDAMTTALYQRYGIPLPE